MRQISVSSTLTVYFDGQFWVGVFEYRDDGRLSACRIVFGAEPATEEVQQFVVEQSNRLHFSESIENDDAPKVASNPKRRQRAASRELKQRGPSTQAQRALSEERETIARQRKVASREQRERTKREQFEQRQEKKRRKHRGH